jgi:hypothetical protein
VSRRQPRRDVFRTTATLRWLIVGVTMLFAALLGIAFVTGPPKLFYGFVALTVFGVLGIVETIVTRVELHDDHIVAVAFFTRRTYRKDEITSVTWAKGSPVSDQRHDVGTPAEHRAFQPEDRRRYSRLAERRRITTQCVTQSVGAGEDLRVVRRRSKRWR